MSKRGGLVYFIKPAKMDGPIKIGHSWVPENRLIDLGSWSPWPLELIGAVSAESSDERFLHSCFADSHSHREWFHSTPHLRETIAKILSAGSIDVVRAELIPVRSIRAAGHKKSPEAKLRSSYRMRIYWALTKLERAEGNPLCYYRQPRDVYGIMDRWQGGYRRPSAYPSPEEIVLLDQFLANPSATAVRHERKLKVVA